MYYPTYSNCQCQKTPDKVWVEELVCANGITLRRFAEHTVSPPFPTGQARFYSLQGQPVAIPTQFVVGQCSAPVGSGGSGSTDLSGVYAQIASLQALVNDLQVGSAKVEEDNTTLVGAIDGVNKTFTVSNNFISGSTDVIIQGLELRIGGDNDYVEVAPNKIMLATAPSIGSNIIIRYNKS